MCETQLNASSGQGEEDSNSPFTMRSQGAGQTGFRAQLISH